MNATSSSAGAQHELAWRERTAELEARERAVADREAMLVKRAIAIEQVVRNGAPAMRRVVANGGGVRETVSAPGGRWNLDRIQRLVEEHADADPGRLEEWRYYLLYLREFAEPGGALPRSFDSLVSDAFGDLLAPTRGAALD